MRQKGILLSLVEAMNLVDENDRAGAVLAGALGVSHHLLDLFDSGEYRGELDELRLGHVREDLRQRGFSRARRPPEDERPSIVAVNLRAQRLAGTDQVLLPHVLVQPARTHSVGQRTGRIGGAACIRDGLKQTHDFAPTTATFSLTNIDDKTNGGTR